MDSFDFRERHRWREREVVKARLLTGRKCQESSGFSSADHRLRGCCGIKGFVSQSPLTLSPQSRLQVLREA